jgi:PleD family two-component response regulator
MSDPGAAARRILGVGAESGSARLVAGALGGGYEVHWAPTGAAALVEAPEVWPDAVLVDATLADVPAPELCRRLLAEGRVPINAPVVWCGPQPPAPETRVAALRMGVRSFLGPWLSPDELRSECEAHVQAKYETDRGLRESLVDARTGLYNRRGLVRRLREIGAQAIRRHESLACLVLEVEAGTSGEPVPLAGRAGGWFHGIQEAARLSDVTGRLGPTTVAVIAPATDAGGAVRLAERLAGALHETASRHDAADRIRIRVGYDAEENLGYAPIEPVAILLRATTAVRSGKPERNLDWVRRFQPEAVSG